jgi:peptidoglycan/xylan/chitin deacetylase (PgdA/CDA1 family)
MDGTASLIYLLAAMEQKQGDTGKKKALTINRGAITRGDTTRKEIAIVFTGDEFGDGGNFIKTVLKSEKIKASFFLTGNFYSNPSFKTLIQNLRQDGHYLGPHSDKHLLYCDWTKRDSLLVTNKEFTIDLLENYKKMSSYGIRNDQARFFMPPYEWYNDTISAWTEKLFSVQLINFTPGTLSNADYTTPEMKNYRSSERIYQSIIDFEKRSPSGLNGFILLVHIGTDPKRTDKFYKLLPQLIQELKTKKYRLITIDKLLQ